MASAIPVEEVDMPAKSPQINKSFKVVNGGLLKKLFKGKAKSGSLKCFRVINEERLKELFKGKVEFGSIKKETLSDQRYLFICMTPRSGSTFLGSLLRANSFPQTGEHFRMVGGTLDKRLSISGAATFEEMFKFIVETKSSPDGLFSTKCDFPQFYPLLASGVFEHYLSNVSWVMLNRNDILLQAISLFIAKKSNYFHTSKEHLKYRTEVNSVEYDYNEILSCLNSIENMRADWERFFQAFSINPLRISYEDLVADAAGTVTDIADFSGFMLPNGSGVEVGEPGSTRSSLATETAIKPVSTQKNLEFKQTFLEDMKKRNLSKWVSSAA